MEMDQLEIARAKNRQYCQTWRRKNRKAYNAYLRAYKRKRKLALTNKRG